MTKVTWDNGTVGTGGLGCPWLQSESWLAERSCGSYTLALANRLYGPVRAAEDRMGDALGECRLVAGWRDLGRAVSNNSSCPSQA